MKRDVGEINRDIYALFDHRLFAFCDSGYARPSVLTNDFGPQFGDQPCADELIHPLQTESRGRPSS